MKELKTLIGLLLISSTVLSSTASATEVIKTCKFKISMPGKANEIPTTYQIVKNGTNLIARTSQIVQGSTAQLPDETATVAEYAVRSGLTPNTPNMNEAERLIVGTQGFLDEPEIGSSFSVGLDLKLIEKATVYQIGKFTHMGGAVIIEARDKNGLDMGSFVTGFMPFACEK